MEGKADCSLPVEARISIFFFRSLSPPNQNSASVSRSQQVQTLQSKLMVAPVIYGGGKKRGESVLLLQTRETRRRRQ